MARVLVADKVSDAGIDILRAGGLEVDVKTGLKEDELVRAAAGCDAIMVRSATKVTAKVIEASPGLRLVGRAGVGVDNIDVEAATSRGVVVMNTPLGNVVSAAEHALALMFSLARNVPAADARMKAGGWDKNLFTGVELSGKTLGVVGLGKIGSIVAKVAQALSMRVAVHDPFLNPRRAEELGVALADLDSLLAEADFVTLHVPLSDSTRGLIGEPELARMKPTARLVNCSRGGVVDEAALAKALREKRIAGAALDVFGTEPLPQESPLRGAPGIVLTPHLGASTAEAQEKVAEDLARQFVEYFRNDRVVNAVNQSVALGSHLTPFAELAEGLGRFVSQLGPGGVSKVEVGCYGEVGSSPEDAHVLSVFALQGVLSGMVDERVNLVNVSHVARARGIELDERRADTARTFRNLVSVQVSSGKGARSVAGTLFDGREARLVQIDGFDIDVRPAPWMLIATYPDRPGVVGRFGTALGEAGINIGGMAVGRRERAGTAMLAVTVDDPVPEAVLGKLRRAVGTDDVHHVRL
jgi:D-3-phosphoglycerate dehydrogenase